MALIIALPLLSRTRSLESSNLNMLSFRRARVAELADALDSKSSDRKVVMVRLHSRAPRTSQFPAVTSVTNNP
jgi:hypothetical protein